MRWRRTRLRSRAMWSALAGVGALVVVGVALAAGDQSTSSATIRACVTTTNGAVRIVREGAGCTAAESALTWNVQGPAGPRGLAGPQGPAGPAGPSGPAGPAGAAGAPGPAVRGSSGATGPAGPAGADGVAGCRWPERPRRPAGTGRSGGSARPAGRPRARDVDRCPRRAPLHAERAGGHRGADVERLGSGCRHLRGGDDPAAASASTASARADDDPRQRGDDRGAVLGGQRVRRAREHRHDGRRCRRLEDRLSQRGCDE